MSDNRDDFDDFTWYVAMVEGGQAPVKTRKQSGCLGVLILLALLGLYLLASFGSG